MEQGTKVRIRSGGFKGTPLYDGIVVKVGKASYDVKLTGHYLPSGEAMLGKRIKFTMRGREYGMGGFGKRCHAVTE